MIWMRIWRMRVILNREDDLLMMIDSRGNIFNILIFTGEAISESSFEITRLHLDDAYPTNIQDGRFGKRERERET